MKRGVFITGTNCVGKTSILRELCDREQKLGGNIPEKVVLGSLGTVKYGFTLFPRHRILSLGFYYNDKGGKLKCGGCDLFTDRNVFPPMMEAIFSDPSFVECFDTFLMEGYLMGPAHWNWFMDRMQQYSASTLLVGFEASFETCLHRMTKRGGKSLDEYSWQGGHVVRKGLYLANFIKKIFETLRNPDDFICIPQDWEVSFSLDRILT